MKKIRQSKTIAVNSIVVILIAIAKLLGVDLTNAEAAELSVVILAFVNIILRFVTKEPIKL